MTDESSGDEVWAAMYGATPEQLAEACRPQEGDSPGLAALKQRSHDYERLLVDARAKAQRRVDEQAQLVRGLVIDGWWRHQYGALLERILATLEHLCADAAWEARPTDLVGAPIDRNRSQLEAVLADIERTRDLDVPGVDEVLEARYG